MGVTEGAVSAILARDPSTAVAHAASPNETKCNILSRIRFIVNSQRLASYKPRLAPFKPPILVLDPTCSSISVRCKPAKQFKPHLKFTLFTYALNPIQPTDRAGYGMTCRFKRQITGSGALSAALYIIEGGTIFRRWPVSFIVARRIFFLLHDTLI